MIAPIGTISAQPSQRSGGLATAKRSEAGGFTFIEILATLTLLAIVLPSVMNGITLCLSTADVAKRQAQASALCHGKLMEMLAQGDWQHGAMAGDFGADWPEFRWTAQVADFNGTVGVNVSWRQSNNKDRSVTLSTLVYTGGTS